VYQPDTVVSVTMRRLGTCPLASLATIATAMGVDRHTVARDLRKVTGMNFRELRNHAVFAFVDGLYTSDTPLSQKEIAIKLGCTSPTAGRWLDRYGRWVKDGRPSGRTSR
jgi:AraC-like DNA-binding protein